MAAGDWREVFGKYSLCRYLDTREWGRSGEESEWSDEHRRIHIWCGIMIVTRGLAVIIWRFNDYQPPRVRRSD